MYKFLGNLVDQFGNGMVLGFTNIPIEEYFFNTRSKKQDKYVCTYIKVCHLHMYLDIIHSDISSNGYH